ncbi:MAG: hypothetical protein M5R40_15920 [Anaerolineae bacterium]|nr:hypothetical protein [Anaerolineae bacterium]
MRKALLLALIFGVALAACRPDPTPTPSPPTATYPPQATPTPLGGPLVIFWSIVDSAADGSAATYTVRINASGGTAPYTYYHGATRLDGATFTVSQPCPPDAPVTFDIRVESADGQADAMQGTLPATCPTPAPLVEATPTVAGAPAIANPDRPPAGRPAFYALTFGASADAHATLLFPAGTARVVARWRHQLIAEDETVHRRITYTPGRPEPTTARPWQEASDTWDHDPDGEATYTIESGPAGAPLEPGVYTLRLSLQSDPYRFVEGAFVVLPEAVEVGGVARFGVPASTDAPQACLLWQIGPTSADLDYRLLDDPTDLLTSWGAQGFAPSPDGARVAYVSAFLGFGGQPVRQPHVYTWDGGVDRALDLDGGGRRAGLVGRWDAAGGHGRDRRHSLRRGRRQRAALLAGRGASALCAGRQPPRLRARRRGAGDPRPRRRGARGRGDGVGGDGRDCLDARRRAAVLRRAGAAGPAGAGRLRQRRAVDGERGRRGRGALVGEHLRQPARPADCARWPLLAGEGRHRRGGRLPGRRAPARLRPGDGGPDAPGPHAVGHQRRGRERLPLADGGRFPAGAPAALLRAGGGVHPRGGGERARGVARRPAEHAHRPGLPLGSGQATRGSWSRIEPQITQITRIQKQSRPSSMWVASRKLVAFGKL